MKKIFLIFILSFLLLTTCAQKPVDTGEQFIGECIGVTDGDTIKVLREEQLVRVRLYGIDCPEKRQAFGNKAKQFTAGLVFKKPVRIVVMDYDRYGRTVGKVYREGIYINLEIIRAGMAWHYKYYSKDADLAAAETEARAAKRGLWSDSNPTPPWDYRRGNFKKRG